MDRFEEFGDVSAVGLIAVTVAESMRAEGMTDAEADDIARQVAWAVIGEHGGQYWYVPLVGGYSKKEAPLVSFLVREVAQLIEGRIAESEKIARSCAAACQKAIGGDYFYVMRGAPIKRASRDQQIWRAFTGLNFRALSKQFDLSEMRIRQIIARERERRAQGRGK
jgi:Mor family transcriptional regulator